MVGSCYVYYRVAPTEAQVVRDRVEQLFARIVERTGVRGRLLAKRDDVALWMEVYEPIADAETFAAALEQSARELDLTRWIVEGKRHVESFTDMPARASSSCA